MTLLLVRVGTINHNGFEYQPGDVFEVDGDGTSLIKLGVASLAEFANIETAEEVIEEAIRVEPEVVAEETPVKKKRGRKKKNK